MPVIKNFNNTVYLKKTLTYLNYAFSVWLMNGKIKTVIEVLQVNKCTKKRGRLVTLFNLHCLWGLTIFPKIL